MRDSDQRVDEAGIDDIPSVAQKIEEKPKHGLVLGNMKTCRQDSCAR
jgi:hypothetical protein